MENEPRRFPQMFYRKLLGFYPKQFREQFGESMEQTFHDVCRKGTASQVLYSFVDTGVGTIKEQFSRLSRRRIMNNLAANPRLTAILGFLLVLPGAAMLSSLMFNIDPPSAFKPYLEGPQDEPHVFGSLIALTLILVLPTIGLLINMASIRKAVLAAPNLLAAAAVGLLFVVPLVLLELAYGQTSYSNFPVALFAILWLLPAAFIAILMPMLRAVFAGNDSKIRPTTLILGGAVLVIIASMWGGIVIDQMPCFLGVPNCD